MLEVAREAASAAAAELDELYERAASRETERSAVFGIAGQRVELRCATAGLHAALTPALRHLAVTTDVGADLVVRVWEGGRHRPSFGSVSRGELWQPSSTDAFGPSYYAADGTLQMLHQPVSRAFSGFDAAAGRAWYWVEDAERVPFWDRAAPLRHVFGWLLAAAGLEQVHAGAVGNADGGVLIVGKSGSGKSTATLAAAVHGRLRYAGDDYVAVAGDGAPFVHSLYRSAKLEPDHMRRFPQLLPELDGPPEDGAKAVAYLDDAWAGGVATGFALRAVIVPEVSKAAAPILRPSSSAAALAALAPSTVFQVRPARGEAFVRIASLLRKLPAFALRLDGDVAPAGAAVAALLSDLGGRHDG